MEKSTTWIATGYEIVAYQGLDKLSIKNLAQTLGVNRSSFYHYFGDMSIFMEELLSYHVAQAQRISVLEEECQNFDPDWIQLMIDHKTELLFNRQLRFHCEDPLFNKCFEQATQINFDKIRLHWSDFIGIHHHPDLALEIFQLSVRAFLFQMTEETLHIRRMQNFFQSIQLIVKQIYLSK